MFIIELILRCEYIPHVTKWKQYRSMHDAACIMIMIVY